MRIKQSASSRWLRCSTISVAFIVVTAGCSDDPDPEPELSAAAAYFAKNQDVTETPNGKIDVDSVEDLDGNWVQYSTADGKTFKVRWTKKTGSDGTTYTYGTAEEIESDQDAD